MTDITKQFTYALADEIYSQTLGDAANTGTLTYTGPAKKFAIVDAATNKLTSASITEQQFETYNDSNTDSYAVEIICDSDKIFCSFLEKDDYDIDSLPTSTAIVANSDPFITYDPVLPENTYEVSEIQYDRSNQSFVEPLPLKAPPTDWQLLLSLRSNMLNAADRTASDDLPTALLNKVIAHKQYLRDFPVTFGANWDVIIGTAGTGYVVGDRMLISDPVFKNGQSAPDILVTVSAVADGTGAITAVTKTTGTAYAYHEEAGTYNDVFYTGTPTGTGATFNLTKIKTVKAFKITPKDNPLA
jgi:hypothetical protein